MPNHLHDRVVAAVGDRYLVEGELGRGGSATVYRAVDLRLHRPVALKVLPPELAYNPDVKARFIREAQTAARLTHPHIVPIYSVDERDGLVYFAMALVDGESLGARLAREGRLPFGDTRRILRDVADALAYAHRHGVVHRDIKPDNILLERSSSRALVSDFGIARAVANDTRLTVTGVAIGTPTYMSPEQALGERDSDPRSDVYSLGVVGYHMLTGAPPFAAANNAAMLVKHVSERPRPVRERRPDAPPALAIAVDHALAKRPELRWASAADFRDALAGLRTTPVGGETSAEERAPAPVAPPASPPPPRAPVLPPLPPPPHLRDLSAPWRGREDHRLHAPHAPPVVVHPQGARAFDDRSLAERVGIFRRKVLSSVVVLPGLAAINVATGGPPWFLIPAAIMGMDLVAKMASMWSDGIGPVEALRKGSRSRLRGDAVEAGPAPREPVDTRSPEDEARRLVGAAVLAGAHGEVVRRAVRDRLDIDGIVSRLGPSEREMLPEVKPTIDGLMERIASLATVLHGVDTDLRPGSAEELEMRISVLREGAGGAQGAERARRLELLEHQRETLQELTKRREVMVAQLESAAIVLGNLRLDLLRLRSAGVGTAMGDVSSATQQARAVSRDIGHVLDAADDVRRL